MIRIIVFLALASGLTLGQLNYEGNPLTEYTEYTAEESDLSERIAEERDVSIGTSHLAVPSRPQKLYPVSRIDEHLGQATETNNLLFDESQRQLPIQRHRAYDGRTSARQFHASAADPSLPISAAEMALNTFLNSKTPEESQAALDHYLRSQQTPGDQSSRLATTAVGQDKKLELLDAAQRQTVSQMEQTQLMPQANQGQLITSQHLVPRPDQAIAVRQQMLPSTVGQDYDYVLGQPAVQAAVQPTIRPYIDQKIQAPGILQSAPFALNLQTRNDAIPPGMWRQRMRRIRGKPFPFAQAKVTPGLYKGPIAVPLKLQAPVEMIYTKPPGFHRGLSVTSNHPGPYEEASAVFPVIDYPPSSKDVYYSQLYAQSYDPHYYNYIATTGKIRPYLYGKLGKPKEEQEDGIWSELYRSFTKHGLKNIMTPTFLLGMTLPVVTLMLSALVQKRTIGRSDARKLDEEDALREYLEKLQRAMERYANSQNVNRC